MDVVQVIPAVDLIGGRVVRLRQGRFDRCQIYDRRPSDLIKRYLDGGASRVHVVDLEGAKQGEPKQLAVLTEMSQNERARVDWSGGLRTLESAQRVQDAGVEGVFLGSIVVTDPDEAERIRSELKIPVRWAVDCREDDVTVNAWTERSRLNWSDLLARAEQRGIREVLVSSVTCDGMDSGPDFALYRRIRARFSNLNLIASGGIRGRTDLEGLSSIGVGAAVVGRALLERPEAFT